VQVRVKIWAFALFLLFPSLHPIFACELTIYTYDSFVAKGGLGPEIFPIFEKQSGCKIKVLASGDAVQALSRLELDEKRGKPQGQILLGIDQTLWQRAKPYLERDIWLASPRFAHEGHGEEAVKEGFVPYDYGVLAFMADSEKVPSGALHSIAQLKDPEWKKKFILEDPRTSTPGLQFVLLTSEVYKDKFSGFWSELKGQWLAMPEGWSSAYGLFLKGEAPLVWSYTTSQAYHEEHGEKRYKAILFDEGQPLQIETAMLIKDSYESEAQKKVALSFLEFLVSGTVQSKVAQTNWMFPIALGTHLPKSFHSVPIPKNVFLNSTIDSGKVLQDWNRAVLQ
jgi:thiamine transport system substrate-binding protein